MISETNVCLDDISQVNGALVDLFTIRPMTQLNKASSTNKQTITQIHAKVGVLATYRNQVKIHILVENS